MVVTDFIMSIIFGSRFTVSFIEERALAARVQ